MVLSSEKAISNKNHFKTNFFFKLLFSFYQDPRIFSGSFLIFVEDPRKGIFFTRNFKMKVKKLRPAEVKKKLK